MSKATTKVREELEYCIVDVQQKRPYTYVRVEIAYSDNEICEEIAFTKASYPDRWNADYGVELAIDKALADFARAVVRGGNNG